MKDESHSIEAIRARGELTEEEMYFVLRFAGHRGYKKAMKRLSPSPLRTLRRKLVWFGGWETPELLQWDQGWPAWRFRREGGALVSPAPVTIFDRLTIFGWGAQLWCFGGFLVWSWRKRLGPGLYWSPDGTPGNSKAKPLLGKPK